MADPTLPAGIPLSTFVGDLHPVAPEFDADPMASFDVMERLGPKVRRYAEALGFENPTFKDVDSQLPLKAFANLTYDETAKMHHSSTRYLAADLRERYEHGHAWSVLDKIDCSAWKWGSEKLHWNEKVACYDGIRRFDLGVDGFTANLDHTTGWNRRGATRHSRVFLDGVFGFLIHHKGRHVMTVGFSFVGGRTLLVQQIQLKERRGNRWLFSFPKNRVEHLVSRFAEAFPTHRILLIDGGDVARHNLASYREGLKEGREWLARCKRTAKLEPTKHNLAQVEEHVEGLVLHQAKIDHIEADVDRLDALYADSGRFVRGKTVEFDGLRHHEMLDASAMRMAA
jgi:hypothetical protein